MPESWGDKDIRRFNKHFNKHRKDFGIKSPAMYAKRAQEFYRRALHEKFPMIRTHAGYLKIYDPKINRFGVLTHKVKLKLFINQSQRIISPGLLKTNWRKVVV